MADANVLSTWAPFLYELQGKVFEVFPSEAPFLAEMSGYDSTAGKPDHQSTVRRIVDVMDGNRDMAGGKSVRHTLVLAGLPGGHYPQEDSTWIQPHLLPTVQINLNLVRALVPFKISVDVERDSMTSASASALTTLVHQARTALCRQENRDMLGDGTGLQASITDAATSLTTTVATTSNFDILLPGTVWDILTRSTGADPGQGLRRKIASVVESTGVITWLTAQQASDGGSGNIVHAATEGIYVTGSWGNGAGAQAPGALVVQGLEQAKAVTGTFETLDKAANVQWQGSDGRKGDTSSAALSAPMLDGAVRVGRRAAIAAWDFGLGDPACIDLFKQGLYNQLRYDPQVMTLKSGFSGVIYDGGDKPFPLIKEPMHKKQGLSLIDKASFIIYGDKPGPAFLEDDGSMFRRTARSLAKEADLLDRTQLGVVKCNTIVFLNNLIQAA
jgi:hypothetical protein